MRISIINGSPKPGKSTSALLAEYFLTKINGHETDIYKINQSPLTEEQISQIQSSDILIFAFPLYVDSLPSHLLRELLVLEQRGFQDRKAMVYCIVNNGFWEGTQNHIAIEQMKLWCESVHLIWGQAIATGAGEMYPLVKNIPFGHGPTKNIERALKELAQNVLTCSTGKDYLISVNWPRFLWKRNASTFFWYPRAKANGLRKQDLWKRISGDSR